MKKTTRIPDLNSIREKLQKGEDDGKADQLQIGEAPVTTAQLKEKWESYAQKLKEDGRDREYNTMNQKVEIGEDLVIRLILPNSFQSLTVESMQQDLLTYLRTELDNKNIQLKTEVEKAEEKKLIYTNSEKFSYLAEKYPNLVELRKRLDLDTDF